MYKKKKNQFRGRLRQFISSIGLSLPIFFFYGFKCIKFIKVVTNLHKVHENVPKLNPDNTLELYISEISYVISATFNKIILNFI